MNIREIFVLIWFLVGKMNSTAFEEKEVKAEPDSEVSEATKGLVKLEIGDSRDDMYAANEFSSTFNPDETSSLDDSISAMNDSFPIPLNANFDLQALMMVREI